ncbi:MAG: tRNA (guanosine(37)-N1)-methyltransferase TrmD [Gammaproteobacteria bacterium]|nr:tRNA (guanosine(37)-N1)-methyltransferase TrmD [Gammaproteobacteria bacterium]
MWLGIVSLFPEMIRSVTSTGVVGRALESGVLDLQVFNPRDYAGDKHRRVDDRPYGGGPGMVMMVPPLLEAIDAAREAAVDAGPSGAAMPKVIYLSPQGSRLSQRRAGELAERPAMILVAGRYEGIDERLVDLAVDEELSVGDYVLSGGELPALVVLDAVCRLLPGVLGNPASAVEESHLDGLLDYPHYTRPESTRGRDVPALLLSGDHQAIARWRRKLALTRTWERRPDLLVGRELSGLDRQLLDEGLAETTGLAVADEE